MSTVSLDASIQECHWQPLSDESIYMYDLTITHPNHGVDDMWFDYYYATFAKLHVASYNNSRSINIIQFSPDN